MRFKQISVTAFKIVTNNLQVSEWHTRFRLCLNLSSFSNVLFQTLASKVLWHAAQPCVSGVSVWFTNAAFTCNTIITMDDIYSTFCTVYICSEGIVPVCCANAAAQHKPRKVDSRYVRLMSYALRHASAPCTKLDFIALSI